MPRISNWLKMVSTSQQLKEEGSRGEMKEDEVRRMREDLLMLDM